MGSLIPLWRVLTLVVLLVVGFAAIGIVYGLGGYLVGEVEWPPPLLALAFFGWLTWVALRRAKHGWWRRGGTSNSPVAESVREP
jgi:hypothetical protein